MKTPTTLLVLIFATLTSSVFAQSSGPIPQSVPLPGTITVSGNAQVLVVPDEATIRIGVVRQASSAKDAQEEAAKIGADILKSIGGLGVPAQRIQTSRLTISPVYGQQRANPGNIDTTRITGYVASNTVTVTLENLSMVGPVVDAGLDNGANQLEGVQFRLKNDAKAREQALKQAVTEAKGKAVAIAEALAVTLGPILEVNENGTSVMPLGRSSEEAVMAMAVRGPNPTPVSPGQLEINASVQLRFAVLPK